MCLSLMRSLRVFHIYGSLILTYNPLTTSYDSINLTCNASFWNVWNCLNISRFIADLNQVFGHQIVSSLLELKVEQRALVLTSNIMFFAYLIFSLLTKTTW